MRRGTTHTAAAFLLVLSTLASPPARAQHARDARLAAELPARTPPAPEAARLHLASIAEPAERRGEGSSAADRTLQSVVGVGTGLVIGGFLGYFVSQTISSDWERLPAGERSSVRRRYMVSGAALGGLTGFLLRPRGMHVGPQPAPSPIAPRAGRQLLTGSDLHRSAGTNAFEAVEQERPEWLQSLPDPQARANVDTVNVAQRSIAVYVGEELVGGVGLLHDIALPEVAELRYYDADEAGRRWGVAHRFGAIEVVPTYSPASTPSRAAAPSPTRQ